MSGASWRRTSATCGPVSVDSGGTASDRDLAWWPSTGAPTSSRAIGTSLSLPGSLRHRLSPLDHSFDNLTIAGDWTDSGFNEGCVEAAVMSGLLAAHAVSGTPALDDIVGFDHP